MIIHRFRNAFPIPALQLALLVIASPWFFAACSLGPSQQAGSPASGTLCILLQNAPESIDPRFGLSAYAATLSELVYASLAQIGEDLQPTPLLARKFEQIDPITFRITLREGLTFHDGSHLTAHDVAYTFTSLLDPATSSPHREKFKYIKTISVISALVVDFKLQQPYAPFLADLAGIGIVPKNEAANVGSGPFRLASWDRNTNQIVLLPHEQWFEGAPKIPRIKFVVVKDPTTRLLELLKGNADLYVGSILPRQLDVLRARAPNLSISTAPGLAYSYLAMNLRGVKPHGSSETQRTRTALANPHVRRAIAHSINIDDIIRFKFLKLADRATGLLPGGHWANDTSISPIRFDPSEARRLLDAAGFPDRGPMNGGRFSLVISTTTDRFRQSLAQILAASLNDIGIKTSVRIQDWGSLFEDIKQGNFEMFSAKWLPVIEPDLMAWVFHSDNIPAENKGGGNRGAYHNADVDKLLIMAREASGENTRGELYRRVQQKLAEDLPYIPLWFEHDIVVQSPRLKGFSPSPTGSLFGLRLARYERR